MIEQFYAAYDWSKLIRLNELSLPPGYQVINFVILIKGLFSETGRRSQPVLSIKSRFNDTNTLRFLPIDHTFSDYFWYLH